jgi:hypothetical protein
MSLEPKKPNRTQTEKNRKKNRAQLEKTISVIKEKWIIVLVYIDDILVFSKNKQDHIGHLQVVFAELINHGIIISKKKMELFKPHIKFLGAEIGEGKIKLQDHISKKILDFEEKILNTEELQKFLGLVNYARAYIKDIGKVIRPLYSKTNLKGQKHFNIEDIKQVKKVEEMVKNLPLLRLPLDADYMIIESDCSDLGWGAILLRKPNKYRLINKGEMK